MAGAGPMAGGADRHAADPHTPLYGSRAGTPYSSRAQPDQIYRDRNSSPAKPAGYSLLGNGPFLLNRRIPGGKAVIAVGANRVVTRFATRAVTREPDSGRWSAPEPMRSITPLGGSGRRSRLPAPQADPPA